MANVGVHRIFDRIAHLYDTGWLQRALYAAVQEDALAELRSLQPRSVLDVGCGTGIFAARLDRELVPGGVTGCDLSGGMLAEAGTRSGRVGWVRGDSAHLPLRAGCVDAVVCTQAFHFFDQPAAWAEFRRVLTPGGHALVGMINPQTVAAARRLTTLSAAARTRVNWPTGPEMRRLAGAAGFDVIGQRDVRWRFQRIAPLVLTVGQAPAP
jgi:ubiquinone/menaquinone biosynthesis C-methylase UbiE